MGIKDWKVQISEFGVPSPLYEGTVRAATWLAALQESRAQMGERAVLPPGASCNVSADGIVVIQDPQERRRYVLVPGEPAAPQGELPPQKDPRPGPSSDQPEAHGWRPAPAPIPGDESQSRPAAAPPLPPSTPSDALEANRGPRRSSTPAADLLEGEVVLLSAREEKPSRGNPLSFRERLYAVPKSMSVGATEKLATKLLKQAQTELASAPEGKFVRIEVFDHVWSSSPKRPPVVRIEWKDWHKSVDIDFPLSERDEPTPAPALTSFPPPPSEDRLSEAFEACHDLLFLKTRAEALRFAARLIEELIPCDTVSASLLDLATDEFRTVAARGIAEDSLVGRAVPASAGLLEAAGSLGEHSLLTLVDATADPRFDAAVDGVPGLDVRALLYRPLVHDGRLYGMIRLASGPQRPMFSQADCEVVDYIAEQLSTFVARGSSWPPPAS